MTECRRSFIVRMWVKDLYQFLAPMKNLAMSDLYTLSSTVFLLDLCVGNHSLKSIDKEDLKVLTDQMKRLAGDVRDNCRMLDRTRVKDMMVRVTSKWSLILQTRGCVQKTIFAWAKQESPQKLKIEKIEAASDSDIDSDPDDESPKTSRVAQLTDKSNIIKRRKTKLLSGGQNYSSSENELDDSYEDLPEL